MKTCRIKYLELPITKLRFKTMKNTILNNITKKIQNGKNFIEKKISGGMGGGQESNRTLTLTYIYIHIYNLEGEGEGELVKSYKKAFSDSIRHYTPSPSPSRFTIYTPPLRVMVRVIRHSTIHLLSLAYGSHL